MSTKAIYTFREQCVSRSYLAVQGNIQELFSKTFQVGKYNLLRFGSYYQKQIFAVYL